MYVLDGLVRHQQAVLVFEVAGGVLCSLDHVLQQREIVRIYSAADALERHRQILIKFKDAIEFLRPSDFVCRYTPRKAASSAETLAFREECLASFQFLLGALAVVDVDKEPIPCRYFTFRIPHRAAASLEPSVNTISASVTMLSFKVLARFDRLFPRLDCLRKIIGMNDTDAGPVLQLLSCLAEILQSLAVDKLNLAHSTRRSHEPGNVVDDLPPGQFPRMQGLLSLLATVDVYTGSVPFEDVARFILQWIGANQEPSMGTVETANSRFRVN